MHTEPNGLLQCGKCHHCSHFSVPIVEKIVWFDIPVNDTKLVDVPQGLQQVIDIQPDLFEAQ